MELQSHGGIVHIKTPEFLKMYFNFLNIYMEKYRMIKNPDEFDPFRKDMYRTSIECH